MEDINITIEETVVPISIIIDESPIGQTGPVGPTGLTGTTPLLSAIGDSIDVSYDNGSTFEELVKFASLSSGGGSEIYQSDTAPDPNVYPTWLYTVDNTLNVWYNEGQVWVNTSHPKGITPPTLATFAAIGDSITDRSTFLSLSAAQNAVCYDSRGWASNLEFVSNRQIVGKGPTAANTYKINGFKDRDHGYSGITSNDYLNGNPVYYGSLKPIDDAIASNPDIFIVHIGTNDVTDQTVETTVARIRALWAALVATGKPVIGTDILQRASAHNSPTVRDKINEVNTILRASAIEDGLYGYRRWNDMMALDVLTGFAADSEYPNNFHPTQPDGIHPGAHVALRNAKDLYSFISDKLTGVSPTIPSDGSASWATPNAYVSGTQVGTLSGLATSWTPQFLGTVGTDLTFSKVTDTEGTWQNVTIINERAAGGSPSTSGIYSRIITTSLVGTQCVATARIRIPAGSNLAGVGFSVQCIGAPGEDWTYNFWTPYEYSLTPLGEFDYTVYSDPFTIPTGTSQVWFLITPSSGTGSFQYKQAGIIKVS